MKINDRTMPSSGQLSKLQQFGESEPFCVLNLIKFDHTAEYADGRESNLTGAEAYELHGHEQQKHFREVSGAVW